MKADAYRKGGGVETSLSEAVFSRAQPVECEALLDININTSFTTQMRDNS